MVVISVRQFCLLSATKSTKMVKGHKVSLPTAACHLRHEHEGDKGFDLNVD